MKNIQTKSFFIAGIFFLILIVSYVNAYDSFMVVREQNLESHKAVLVYHIDSSEISENYTILKILKTDVGFEDLKAYSEAKNINQFIAYSTDMNVTQENIDGGVFTFIKRKTGIPVIVKFATADKNQIIPLKREAYQQTTPQTQNTPAIQTTSENQNQIADNQSSNLKAITDNAVSVDNSKQINPIILTGLIIGLCILIGFIILAIIIKKR